MPEGFSETQWPKIHLRRSGSGAARISDQMRADLVNQILESAARADGAEQYQLPRRSFFEVEAHQAR